MITKSHKSPKRDKIEPMRCKKPRSMLERGVSHAALQQVIKQNKNQSIVDPTVDVFENY